MKFLNLFIIILFSVQFCFADPIQDESIIHGLSDAIVQGCKSDETKIYELMQFTHQKIKPKVGADPYEKLTTLQRIQQEVGWCNHSSTVFMHLAYYQEIKTRLLYLMNSEGESPHTIVEAWLDGRWVIIDPLFNLWIRNKERQLISRDDLKGDLSLLLNSPSMQQRKKELNLTDEQLKDWCKCYINTPVEVFEYNPIP